MPDLDKFVGEFFPDAKEISEGTYAALCPCHLDNVPSLHISRGRKDAYDGGKVIVMNCKAGCRTEEILDAVGASMEDLAGHDPLRISLEKGFSFLGENVFVADIYDYTDMNGRYLYSKVRFEGTYDGKKQIRYVQIDYDTRTYTAGKGSETGGMFNVLAVRDAIQKGRTVFICEGEKDVRTLQKLGFSACTYGGAKDWRPEYKVLFKGSDVVILPDNDDPGREVAHKIALDLKDAAYKIKTVTVSKIEKGDITDYMTKENGTREEFLKMVDEAEQHYGRFVSVTTNKHGEVTSERINADLLADVVSKNEDYLFVRNPYDDHDTLYLYRSGVYEHTNRSGLISSIIRPYIPVGKAAASTFDNVYKLILSKGTHTAGVDELDSDEKYINVKNGLLNIRTMELEPHRPDIYSTVQLNVTYDPDDNSMPVFTKYMSDLASDESGECDKEKLKVWQQYGGLILSNIRGYRVKKALFLVSPQGNSGKSVFVRLLQFLLGNEHSAAISLQMMDGGAYNRFNLGTIAGKRLLSCGDQSAASIKDSSVFKRLTGGDETNVEAKGKQGYSYRFKGLIAIACNGLPYFEDDFGKHLIDRMLITPCRHVVPEAERDEHIDEFLEAEAPAIFNFFLGGLRDLIANGFHFTQCSDSERAADEYRSDSDSLYSFIKSEYEITGDKNDRIAKTEFEDAYDKWAEAQIILGELYSKVRRKNIRSRMASYGVVCRRGHIASQDIHGKEVYFGIRKRA